MWFAKFRQLCFCLITLLIVPIESTCADEVVTSSSIAIVVHKDTEVDNLSLAELRSIFLADQQFWKNRKRIILLVRAPQSDERDFVLNRIYRMSEAQFRQYWISKMFRAEVPRGPKIVFSTDSNSGWIWSGTTAIEFERRHAAGQTTKDAIVSATTRAAKALFMDDVGNLEEGMLADIIAVDGNPLEDITALGRSVFVMKDGEVVKRPHR